MEHNSTQQRSLLQTLVRAGAILFGLFFGLAAPGQGCDGRTLDLGDQEEKEEESGKKKD